MLVSVGDVRLFVDVDGAKLVPDGMSMRERPTIVLIHGGPGSDHTLYKEFYASLAEVAQVVCGASTRSPPVHTVRGRRAPARRRATRSCVGFGP